MPLTNDKDLSEDFTCSEAKAVAKASGTIDSEASEKLIKSIVFMKYMYKKLKKDIFWIKNGVL